MKFFYQSLIKILTFTAFIFIFNVNELYAVSKKSSNKTAYKSTCKNKIRYCLDELCYDKKAEGNKYEKCKDATSKSIGGGIDECLLVLAKKDDINYKSCKTYYDEFINDYIEGKALKTEDEKIKSASVLPINSSPSTDDPLANSINDMLNNLASGLGKSLGEKINDNADKKSSVPTDDKKANYSVIRAKESDNYSSENSFSYYAGSYNANIPSNTNIINNNTQNQNSSAQQNTSREMIVNNNTQENNKSSEQAKDEFGILANEYLTTQDGLYKTAYKLQSVLSKCPNIVYEKNNDINKLRNSVSNAIKQANDAIKMIQRNDIDIEKRKKIYISLNKNLPILNSKMSELNTLYIEYMEYVNKECQTNNNSSGKKYNKIMLEDEMLPN